MNARTTGLRRVLSFCLCLALLLGLLPMLPQQAQAASQTINIYFKNTDGWSNVCGYAWKGTSTTLMGDWPGTALTKNSDGLYVLSLSYDASVSGTLNFIFNNGSSGEGNQTADLSLNASQLLSCQNWWVSGSGGSPAKYAPPEVDGSQVTFTYEGSASEVQVAGSFNGWSAVDMTKSGSAFTYTTTLESGQYEYKFIVDGSWISDPCNPITTGSDSNSVFSITSSGGTGSGTTLKIHFLNSVGWSSVMTHNWVSVSTGDIALTTWPGNAVSMDANGYYTVEVTRNFSSGQGLGILFHNGDGVQTADAIISASQIASGNTEFWIQPGSTPDSEGKYPVTVSSSETGIFRPHVFGDGKVTFNYNGSGSEVYLAGSFNNWSTSATKMTKNSDGVWSATVDLEPGVYEYKYVVDGEWILDPNNGVSGGYDGNSVVVVPSGKTHEAGKITVKLHFYRESGEYDGWDVWFWGSDNSGSADFTTVTHDKGMVATFTVNGISTSQVGYVVRKSDWSDKEFYDRFIDVSDISAGTVHFFLNSGSADGSRVLDKDTVAGSKPTYANLNYDTGKVWVTLSNAFSGDVSSLFGITGPDSTVKITAVEVGDGGYDLSLSRKLTPSEAPNYKVTFQGAPCAIQMQGLFYSGTFANDYGYYGDDLGATYSEASTTFKVWAPTAQKVHLKLYDSGNWGSGNQLQYVEMKQGEKGVWYVTVTGDLHGVYYNYDVTFPTYTVEATDPYAKGVGANGDRGMIVDFDRLDPAGWDNDSSPNQGMNYTDAIIYEMHVREMTIDSSSGVKSEWRGKYLGMTQAGTNYEGRATGLDHLKELGITHVQLMPVFDFNSVDEYHLTDWEQYAWGYDPKNFNAPEGGYSTDPFNGATRITEFKQMVQTFHSNGINVVMDVVYNHAFDGGNFCGNKIVPNYYSRFYGEGNWSNGSGVGNDMATERVMVRNMIVDSIMHWVEEYHIDGFRFDLAGLIDTQTINEITSTVQAKYPYVIFYGEGWAPGGTAVEYGYDLATQGNAWQTGAFAHFNDGFRNAIAGDDGKSWGFASGSGDYADKIADCFRGSNGWSTSPSQTINYVSCHDNYCLTDKIIISRDGAYWDQMARMNGLSNALVLLSQGIPFIYSGDELLREKKDADGNRYHNGYNSDDYVSKIRWSDLVDKEYAQRTDDYYAGLIAFRKNHAALRCPGGADAWGYTNYSKINNNTILFYNTGYPNYECSDGIVMIFNGSDSTQWVNIYDHGVPYGEWQACIHGTQAGTSALWTTTDGSVGVEPFSVTVLVKGDLIHEESVYNKNLANLSCSHPSHNTSGNCTSCGAAVSHSYDSGKVTTAASCGKEGVKTFTCSVCGGTKTETISALSHSYSEKVTTAASCGKEGVKTFTCANCGDTYTEPIPALEHNYVDGTCQSCGEQEKVEVQQPGFEFTGASLLFEDEIFYNFYFMPSNTADVVEYGIITFTTKLADGTHADAVDVIPGAVDNGDGTYTVRTNGIPAKEMGDWLYFRVYAKLSDDSYAYATTYGYRATAYANTVLSGNSDTKTKALMVAMLNYGAAAQKYFGHNTDSLMNASLTEDQKALVDGYSADMLGGIVAADSSKTAAFPKDSTCYTPNISVSFEGAFAVNYYFTPKHTPDGELTMYYWDAATYNSISEMTRENATSVMTLEKQSDGSYLGAVEGIAAKEVDSTIYVALVYTSGGTEYCSGILAYSLGTYFKSVAGGTSTAQPLGAAVAAYSYYAKQYFAN